MLCFSVWMLVTEMPPVWGGSVSSALSFSYCSAWVVTVQWKLHLKIKGSGIALWTREYVLFKMSFMNKCFFKHRGDCHPFAKPNWLTLVWPFQSLLLRDVAQNNFWLLKKKKAGVTNSIPFFIKGARWPKEEGYKGKGDRKRGKENAVLKMVLK